MLTQHFIDQFNRENNNRLEGFSAEAMNKVVGYPWPGNVRELENFLERLVILKKSGKIEMKDLPEKVSGYAGSSASRIRNGEETFEVVSFRDAVSDFENKLILKALEKTGWNKNRAAELLQLNRTTLVEKMKKKRLEKVSE